MANPQCLHYDVIGGENSGQGASRGHGSLLTLLRDMMARLQCESVR